MNRHFSRSAFALCAVFTGLPPSGLVGQTPFEASPGSAIQTRVELEHLLDQYELVLESTAYSGDVKEDARARVARIQERLTHGDFRLGDRVVLLVQNEPDLPDTVTVQSGPRITLPTFGDITLDGVLRSELEDHITESLRRYIREPVVQARGLMRISVQGAVGNPGFFHVPADMLLSETLMIAGGPASSAKTDEVRIERGTEVVMGGDETREAIRLGFTLDQLNLQAGDQVVVPVETAGGVLGRVGVVAGIIGSLTLLILRIGG